MKGQETGIAIGNRTVEQEIIETKAILDTESEKGSTDDEQVAIVTQLEEQLVNAQNRLDQIEKNPQPLVSGSQDSQVFERNHL